MSRRPAREGATETWEGVGLDREAYRSWCVLRTVGEFVVHTTNTWEKLVQGILDESSEQPINIFTDRIVVHETRPTGL